MARTTLSIETVKRNQAKGTSNEATWHGATPRRAMKRVVKAIIIPGDRSAEYFSESDTHTTCPWKGEASYYDISVNGE
jgi:hypothetical protein